MADVLQVLGAAASGVANSSERPLIGANWASYWAGEDEISSPVEELVMSMRSTRSKVAHASAWLETR